MKIPTFALIGAAGYIAPRHMKAIKSVGGELLAAMDINDSVGILDSYFPDCQFFNSFERFERHISKLYHSSNQPHYLVICSPNYLHDTHCRFGLQYGMDVICEKPLVLNPWNINSLQKSEEQSGQKIWNIMQLRLHPNIINLKNKVDSNSDHIYKIKLDYITSRGPWYNISWKGEISKSGGIATNIGIHLFDMLFWIFGDPISYEIQELSNQRCLGIMKLNKAEVEWHLSINNKDLPQEVLDKNHRTYRRLIIDNSIVDFTNGFEDLHTQSYRNILEGVGFRSDTALKAIKWLSEIREQYQKVN